AEFAKITKDGKGDSQQFINLAEWALSHGLLKEFEKSMDELAKVDKSHPSFVAYEKVKADLARQPGNEGRAAEWRGALFRNYRITTTPSTHYALLNKAPRDDVDDVKSRLKALEENMTAFYYWHALKGKKLEVPQERLSAVLETVNKPSESPSEAFDRYNKLFGSLPVAACTVYSH